MPLLISLGEELLSLFFDNFALPSSVLPGLILVPPFGVPLLAATFLYGTSTAHQIDTFY
jgi:hypothetical protein